MIRIYLTNLGKYNEGHLIGEWVDLPVDEDELEEVKERIGINEQYEEWFITDYETDIDGLEIGEYEDIEELNEIAEEIEQFSESEKMALSAMIEHMGNNNLIDAVEKVKDGDYRIFYNCDDMEDVAYEVIEESGMLDGVPESIANYFDYEAYGRDLKIEGNFYEIENGIIEIY